MKRSGFPIVEVECDVCGGPGGLSARDLFGPGEVRHIDPRTCQRYLAKQRAALEKDKQHKEADL